MTAASPCEYYAVCVRESFAEHGMCWFGESVSDDV